jgi:hypothetical protein
MRSPVLRDVADVGDCVISVLGDGRLRIDRADPRTLIYAGLLEKIRNGRCNPHVYTEGDLLYIEGADRLVVYRVGEMVSDRDAYLLEWPD